ncbi:MAG: AAA family ATPase [Ruminococcaceae bacterium]|nr:AAA family ATPase [Oscillospiraceae bacterium]
MLFYKIQGVMINAVVEEEDRRARREARRKIATKSEMFNTQYCKNVFYFVSDSSEGVVTIGVISNSVLTISNYVHRYLNYIGLPLRDLTISEVTFSNLKSLLNSSHCEDYIDDDDAILEKYNLDKIDGRQSVEYGENISVSRDKPTLVSLSEKYLMNETLLPELERIYAGKKQSKASGHPVHYMVQTDDRETRREVYKIVLDALYSNGRLESQRYTYCDIRPGEQFSTMSYDALYQASIGGAVVVRYLDNDDRDDVDVAFGDTGTVEILCEAAKRYRNEVLTVFCLSRECSKAKDRFFENLGSISIVELKEDLVKADRAKEYLVSMAKGKHVRVDKKLFVKLEEDKTYLATELKGFFEEWYNGKLRSAVYPQYSCITAAEQTIATSKPKGSAYSELDEMIGLEEAKKVINKALNYYKMQKLFRDRGIKEDHPAMHMIFTGNPGTAKTTVARLFAQIMRENNLLSKGQLVEVGRGDLIAKYVGWTAQTVQSKFKAAKGGVLFIDEAYSLVDDRDGCFGDEAINTIVQEMENHREEVIVIFAGYPDKMEGFLNKNPGLRSRIAFHVPFADYSSQELCRIAGLIARGSGMTITSEAMSKLESIFEVARSQSDFGNGRYVRNIFEQSKMNQASRLLEKGFESITERDVFTLTADDIIAPPVTRDTQKRKIGFC